MQNSDLYPDRESVDMFGALIDSVSERVAERICGRIEEKLQHRQRIQQTSQSSLLSSPDSEEDQLITKAEACHLLDRCDSTQQMSNMLLMILTLFEIYRQRRVRKL